MWRHGDSYRQTRIMLSLTVPSFILPYFSNYAFSSTPKSISR